ncbi:hypothetical protein [[Mycoplasma] testudinis]|uniref:hypothetical protein n=1 Tax=[Mycoplasma] testudinis TaxID=33924 RepID=UPI00069688E4|nr:hypothetical protein [[Mycoplasma] testudinis]
MNYSQQINQEGIIPGISASANSSFALSIFGILLALVLVFTFAKKVYFFVVRKQRYFVIPRVSVYGMTNIAIIIAIAVSIIILIMAVTGGLASVLFRAYPGTRVTIEIILVKIAGLLFGPIIGVVSGAIIDILTVALSGGFFHYGYFIAAIITGLLSGLLRVVITTSKVGRLKDLFLAIYASLFMIASAAVVIILISQIKQIGDGGLVFNIPGLNIDVTLSLNHFFYIIIGFTIFILAIIWLMFIVWFYKSKRYYYPLTHFTYKRIKHPNHKNRLWLNARKNWYNSLVSVIVLAASATLIMNILFLPIFDAEITAQPYTYWLLFRTIIAAPALFVIDIIVIYPVLLVISPIIKYNYEDELVEDLKTPLFNETWKSLNEATPLISKEQIKNYSKTLLFEPDEKQLTALENEFSEILNQFETVAEIDTTDFATLDYPIPTPEKNLREDKVNLTDELSDIMSCPKNVQDGLVKVC